MEHHAGALRLEIVKEVKWPGLLQRQRLYALPNGCALTTSPDEETLHVFNGAQWTTIDLNEHIEGFGEALEDLDVEHCIFRAGSGFGIATQRDLVRWRHVGAEPEYFAITGAWPTNHAGWAAAPHEGGVSIDANRPVLIASRPAARHHPIYPAALKLEGKSAHLPLDEHGALTSVPRHEFPPSHLDDIGMSYPVVQHAAWDGERMFVFTVGTNPSYVKWGMEWSILSSMDGSGGVHHLARLEENHSGTFTSSLQYVILEPLHQNGPSRGRPSLLALPSGEPVAVELPHGHAAARIDDHDGVSWWLTSEKTRRWLVCRAM